MHLSCRPSRMRFRTCLAITAIVLAGCTATGSDEGDAATAEMMAAALHQLVTVDNTFGGSPPPFSEYLILDHIDTGAGDPATVGEPTARDLGEEEQAAIEASLGEFGTLRWIDDPDEWRTDGLLPKVEGSVILGVGEPDVDGDVALVPVSLWCGPLCGTWLTYRVELSGDTWAVTGIEGPVAIS